MFEKTFLEKMRAPVTQTGLRIYKNNIHSARMAALDDIFPAVKAFAGEEFFKQACFFYAADNDGVVSNLNLYGKNFGSYLSALPQCHPYPYLRDIADFEYDIRRIFYFRDQDHVTLEDLAVGKDVNSVSKAMTLFTSEYEIHEIIKYALDQNEKKPNMQKDLRHYLIYRDPDDLEVYIQKLDHDIAEIFPILYKDGLNHVDQTYYENENFNNFITFLVKNRLFVV